MTKHDFHDQLPLAIYYEHPDWFRPLFAELDKRAIPYVKLDARAHFFRPEDTKPRYSLFFNRMSPSAYLRQVQHGIFYTQSLLAQMEYAGVPVINGTRAYTIETSKALQLSLLESLGLPYPRARVISHANQAVEAARDLRFPIVVKANIGGSGAGIVRYDSGDALQREAEAGNIDLGIDGTALVQEFIPAREGHITRVETLGGKYLYAIKVFSSGDEFNLCPADACQTNDGVELVRGACAVDAPKTGLRVEGYDAPSEVREAVERIFAAAQIDVGGVEYTIDERDGSLLYYDINALSNFVADAPRVIGFDPFARLVDYIEERMHG